MANILVHYDKETITAIQSFIVQAQGTLILWPSVEYCLSSSPIKDYFKDLFLHFFPF
jgi:hypothetical protein